MTTYDIIPEHDPGAGTAPAWLNLDALGLDPAVARDIAGRIDEAADRLAGLLTEAQAFGTAFERAKLRAMDAVVAMLPEDERTPQSVAPFTDGVHLLLAEASGYSRVHDQLHRLSRLVDPDRVLAPCDGQAEQQHQAGTGRHQ